MNMPVESTFKKKDRQFEQSIRPSHLEHFVGQKAARAKLDILLGAAKKRSETPSHSLFYGPPGLGKTTLAHILAAEMGTKLITTSGPMIDKPGDLAGLLTSLDEGDIFFIDEIHRLPRTIEEYLYSAMEDFALDIMLDTGPGARSVNVKLKPFCLVGATTRLGLLSGPLRSRFGFQCRLEFYSISDLTTIAQRSAKLLKFGLDEPSAREIAQRSRGTPRIANNLVRWVRDYVATKSPHICTLDVTKSALKMLNIDEKGLGDMDKRILKLIIDHHKGGPVGLGTIAAGLSEEASTIEEVYEPFLIMQGLLKRTLRGREATSLAYDHLGES